jgi:hypothetical protein
MNTTICALALLFQASLLADWTPPAKPDAFKILNEARGDREAGQYADALAKHVWFHKNGLKYQRSLYGVRLSFALMDWVELGNVYPPALLMLKTVRDESGKKVRDAAADGKIFETFHDFAAINRALKEDAKTTELFVWLDANKPQEAKRAYGVAEPALIQSKQYRLCGKYIDADRSFAQSAELYRMNKRIMKDVGFADKMFSDSVATLVALLALNNHKDDANRVAEKALKEHDAPEFKQTLEKAKKGELPPTWP